MLRTREWARRYCDMLDGAEEAPTVNELYKAIELDEDDLVKDAFVQADRYTDQSMKEAMKWRMAYYHERSKVGDLQDEVNWLNAELHGAEQRAERTCHTIPYNSQAEDRADTWKITAVCSECGWTLEMKKGDKVRMHDPYCGGCGAKVVE